ncbi:MAG: PqqD family protein [Campylobacterales bacterium]|nr:PqqD family protein [Campylobacterales bacterium]
MDLNQKIIFSPTVFAQMVDDEMVLLDMNSENYFGLDEVGTSIWQVMQEQETLEKVFETLLEEYDVSADILKKDLEDFVQKLVDNGLVEVQAA